MADQVMCVGLFVHSIVNGETNIKICIQKKKIANVTI